MNVIDSLIFPKNKSRNMSPIWKGFMNLYHWVGQFLTWQVCNEKHVLVGIDPIIGLEDDYKLIPYVTNYLAEMGYYTLAHIKKPIWLNMDRSYWYSTKYMGLVQDHTSE